jgi:chromosomal replication initiator protein
MNLQSKIDLMSQINYFGFPGVRQETKKMVSDDIIRLVEETFRVTMVEMKSKSRQRNIVEARHMAMYLMRKNTLLRLKQIGELFDSRDHTTVIHACKRIKDMADSYPEFKMKVQELSFVHCKKNI